MLLGVNIDHIAVLREARGVNDPDIIDALAPVKRGGGDQITIHLREDRRHIRDEDAALITRLSPLPVNIECAIAHDIIAIIADLAPHRATLVPEKREEVTTEGGLDIARHRDAVRHAVATLKEREIGVSLFIEPTLEAVELSAAVGADMVEFHTGAYANLFAALHTNIGRTPYRIPALDLPRTELARRLDASLDELARACIAADHAGLAVAAGHGLNYPNVALIAAIPGIRELNIGQSIVARSVFTGLETAVRQMKEQLS